MQGNEAVLEFLNEVLTAELTAINQYFIDSKMMGNWGYQRLADKVRADSIDEMGDAEKLIDRILYLDGVPNLEKHSTGDCVQRRAGPRPRSRYPAGRARRRRRPGDRSRRRPDHEPDQRRLTGLQRLRVVRHMCGHQRLHLLRQRARQR